jgi:tight adherence protein C
MQTGTANVWLLLGLFVGTFMSVWWAISALQRRAALRHRFRALERPRSQHDSAAPLDSRWSNELDRWAGPLAALSMPNDRDDVSALRRSLLNAGWRSSLAVTYFVAFRSALVLGLPILVWLGVLALPGQPLSLTMQALVVIVTAWVGYAASGMLLAVRVARRQRAIFEAFPDALDLMLVCVESGLGLDLAMQRVAHEIRLRCPALADELELVCADVRAGSARDYALQRLSYRVGLDEMAGFSSMITQADRFGTSIGDALRVQADALRTTRRLRAQEQAAKVPVKLMLPLVFCIFPSIFTVLLGPAAIRIWRVMVPALQSAG